MGASGQDTEVWAVALIPGWGAGGTISCLYHDRELAYDHARRVKALVIGPIPIAADLRHETHLLAERGDIAWVDCSPTLRAVQPAGWCADTTSRRRPEPGGGHQHPDPGQEWTQ